jgi:putative sigma-54 modulation protein
MELQIRANGTKVTDGMREFIDRRMTKLDRLADRVVDAQLELRTETTRTEAEITTAQLTLRTRKHVLRAEAQDVEAARAIDMVIDKLITQVRRYNDKRTSRKRRGGHREYAATAATETALPGDLNLGDIPEGVTDEFEVARTKSFQMDPMDVETAIEQMELIGHDFFFFKNEEDEKFSVLYRRRDGTYGILSPE